MVSEKLTAFLDEEGMECKVVVHSEVYTGQAYVKYRMTADSSHSGNFGHLRHSPQIFWGSFDLSMSLNPVFLKKSG